MVRRLLLLCSMLCSCIYAQQKETLETAHKALEKLAQAELQRLAQQSSEENAATTLLADQDIRDHVLQTLAALPYDTAEKVEIPVNNYVLELNWGFGNSGDWLLPLPAMNFQIKDAPVNADPSVQGLAFLLARKNLLDKANERVGLRKIIETASKNPVLLFGLKTILLVKDYKNQPETMRQELARLIMRLSLTKLPEAVAKTTRLTALLPTSVLTLLNAHIPEAGQFIDAAWQAIIQPEDTAPEMLCSYQCLVVKFEDTARLIAKACEAYNNSSSLVDDVAASLASRGFTKVSMTEVLTADEKTPAVLHHIFAAQTHTPASLQSLPEEVQSAFKTASLQKIIQVNTAQKGIWFIYKSESLTASDTAYALAMALVSTGRRVVKDRQAYFAQHPTDAHARKHARTAQIKQKKHIEAFVATPLGKSFDETLHARITATRKRLAYSMPAHDDVTIPAAVHEKMNQLITLKEQAASFAKLEVAVPEEVQAAIASLQKEIIAQGGIVPTEQAVVINHRAILQALTREYEAAAHDLAEELDAQKSAIEERLEGTRDHIDAVSKRAACDLAQIPARSYLAWLQAQASRLQERMQQLERLRTLRLWHARGVLDHTQEAALAEMSALEMTVGYLLAARTVEEFISYLLREDGTLDDLKHELFMQPGATYAKLRNELADRLAQIIKQSPHIQENLDIYRYMIALCVPSCLPTFDQLIALQATVL